MLMLLTFLFLLANPACEPATYPVPPLPFAVDPNWGQYLPAFPSEPNRIDVVPGPWQREWARACDPDGDPFEVSCDDPNVSVQLAGGQWTFSLTVQARSWHVLQFTATDSPMDAEPATSRYWTVIEGMDRPNRPPVLY